MTPRPTLRILAAAASAALGLGPALAGAGIVPRPVAGPFDADPAAIRVAVELPPGVGLEQDSAALVMHALGGPDGASDSSQDALADMGTQPARGGGTLHQLRLAYPGAADLIALQQTAQAWRAKGAVPQSAIEITFSPCRKDGATPKGAPFSLSVRFATDGPVLRLTAPDATLTGMIGRSPGSLPLCK